MVKLTDRNNVSSMKASKDKLQKVKKQTVKTIQKPKAVEPVITKSANEQLADLLNAGLPKRKQVQPKLLGSLSDDLHASNEGAQTKKAKVSSKIRRRLQFMKQAAPKREANPAMLADKQLKSANKFLQVSQMSRGQRKRL